MKRNIAKMKKVMQFSDCLEMYSFAPTSDPDSIARILKNSCRFPLKSIYISESTSWRNRVPRIIDCTARAWLPFQIKLTSVGFALGDKKPSKLSRFDAFVQR